MSKKKKDNERNVVKMIRSKEDAQGGPTEADVHPDEMENFRKHGWKEAD